jgi:hypothetical protein
LTVNHLLILAGPILIAGLELEVVFITEHGIDKNHNEPADTEEDPLKMVVAAETKKSLKREEG